MKKCFWYIYKWRESQVSSFLFPPPFPRDQILGYDTAHHPHICFVFLVKKPKLVWFLSSSRINQIFVTLFICFSDYKFYCTQIYILAFLLKFKRALLSVIFFPWSPNFTLHLNLSAHFERNIKIKIIWIYIYIYIFIYIYI